MIKDIDLPQKIFLDRKLTGLSIKNFIFGKNGTGKSSIRRAIKNQYSDTYDVRIFQGFRKIVQDNGGLTAIALGRENAELQPKIDEKKRSIYRLKKEIEKPETGVKFILEKSKKDCKELCEEIEKNYIESARNIKNNHTDWTGPNYNKNSFKKDIENQCLLDDKDIKKYKAIIKEEVLNNQKNQSFENPKIQNYLKAVNEIITKDVSKTAVLKFESTEKENWVKKGMSLHAENDICSFCGSKISSTRWDDLNSYFNNEVKKLEKRLNDANSQITEQITKIKKINTVSEHDFYLKFRSDVKELNINIMKAKRAYTEFLEVLLANIEKRRNNIFVSLDPILCSTPTEFDTISKSYYLLVEKNESYSMNLEKEKKRAKEKLRLNKVAEELKSFNYLKKKGQLDQLEKNVQQAEVNFNNEIIELDNKKKELLKLSLKTRDESIAAENINQQLRTLGNQSFKLKKDESKESKGLYKIIGNDGNERNISTLSTGEKNIVAFLWFMNDLKNPKKKSDKDMVIVFDDPMNSNDDTTQYLIVSKLQKLLKETKTSEDKRQIFILTHNTHFYCNVRFHWWNGEKQPSTKKTFHLEKCGEKTKIKTIQTKSDDIETSYDELWEEVIFLYKNKKPNFMLNPLRRILETYKEFNKISDEELYFKNEGAKKLFNVNSHGIEDFQTDLNGKNEEDIMNIVEDIFKNLNATKHFNHYWKI